VEEHILLGFVIFISLTLLFIAWALHQGQKTMDRLIEEDARRYLERRSEPPDPHRFGPP
jgi:hypothetical protein